MNQGIVTWMLAGALAVSLSWNLWGRTEPREAAPECGGCAIKTTNCASALATLELSTEQKRALEDWSKSACGGEHELAAEKGARELFALLGSRDLDVERARALAIEVSRLRGRSLQACVESLIGVRRVLRPDQVEQLLQNCCSVR